MKKSYVVLEPFCPVCAPDTAETEHHFVFDCPAYCSIRDSFTAIFWGPAPALSSFFTLHDHRVIAKFLHECFAHRSMLLEGVLGVPQHQWLAFTSSYHCHSVDDHECTKDNLIRCLFVYMFHRLLVKWSWLPQRPKNE